MNALIVTLWAERPVRLPLAYNALIQGALYENWRETFPELHDEGYSDGPHRFRMFTFSPLRGRYRVQGKEIFFEGAIRLEIRSPVSELIGALCDSLQGRGAMRLGRSELPIVNLESADRFLFFPHASIRTLSPVTVHETEPNGRTAYYSPADEMFLPLLAGNLASKLRAIGIPAAPVLTCVPNTRTLRKRVTTFKGTYVTAYEGRFELWAEPEAVALLYYAGLGSRNSQGFGMFAIENEK